MATRSNHSPLTPPLFATVLCAIWGTDAISDDNQQADAPPAGPNPAVRPNMVGSYGPWLAEKVLGDGPARLSFRTGKWKSLSEWQSAARARAWECIAPIDLG